mgnify:CR=1 FL=1
MIRKWRKLNSIVETCMQITADKKRLSWKDLLEEDRIVVLLSIRDLTFPEPENKLVLKGKTEKTKKQVDVELAVKNLVPSEIDEEIERYYSEKELLEVSTRFCSLDYSANSGTQHDSAKLSKT